MSLKNKLLTGYYRWKYRNEIREITRCQDEILELGTHPHFDQYRREEMLYWLPVTRLLQEHHAVHPVTSCLDIGAAYGTLALYCKRKFGCSVYCIDFVDHFIGQGLLEKHGFHFAHNNIELDKIPWHIEFDVILLTEVLEHFNFNAVPTLQKTRNMLSDGGKLFISTPDASEWGTIDKYHSSYNELPEPDPEKNIVDDHVYIFNRNELLTIFQESGLHVDRLLYSPGTGDRHFIFQLSAE